jgi:hypothetical protein
MFTIQCTKKLLDELKIDIGEKKVIVADPIFSWHSHLFLINRKKCAIVMNNKTRFNFILFGLKKADFKEFSSLVAKGIKENFMAEGIDGSVVDKYIQECNEAIYTTSSDKSIISQMNEMKRCIEDTFISDKIEGIETDIDKLNRWLNRFVMLKLPKLYSGETMKDELLERFSDE